MTTDIKRIIAERLEKADGEELVMNKIEIKEISKDIQSLLESQENLSFLNFKNCGLVSLNNFPKIENLIHLDLSSNKFPISDIKELTSLTNIQSISLCNLSIKTIEDIRPLTKLKSLVQLELIGNPITEIKDYREIIFKEFKKLEFLDHKNAEGKEYEYSSDENEEDDEEDISEESEEYDESEDDEDSD